MAITENLFGYLLKDSNKNYNLKLVSQCIIKLKYCKDEKTLQETKLLLFRRMSKLIVKAINNFFSLVDSFPEEKILHSQNDIAIECYIIMNTCVKNLKITEVKKFYFYLNTSLNRGIYRIYERNYKKHFDVISNTDDNQNLMMNKKHHHHFDMTEIDLRSFSVLEISIIKFKVSGEKLKPFLKENKLTDLEFSELFNVVKQKLTQLYGRDNNNTNI
jgi:hypothetical protein